MSVIHIYNMYSMYKEVSINISSFAVERSQVFVSIFFYVQVEKAKLVVYSKARSLYNEDSEASVCNSVVGHQKINTNAMSFVHRFMNAVCACLCVCKCVRVAGFCGAETRSACVWRHLVA